MAKKAAKARPKRRLPLVVVDAEPSRTPVDCLACALCCTYVAVGIEGPKTVKASTEILWHLYHQNVSVYRDTNDEWLVQFETRCRHLQADNRCGIYETRPHICREYSELGCEVNAHDEGQTFHSPAAFLAYLKERSTRIYRAVERGYLPTEEHLKPKAKRSSTSFEARYNRLRLQKPTLP